MTYPATFAMETPHKIARWRPFVQWLLAIPHLIVAYAFSIVASICLVVAWFAIVITAKMPAGLATVLASFDRYQTRVIAYAGFLTDKYPPFDSSDASAHPVNVSFEPALENRNRLTVLLRVIWIIPAYLFFVVLYFAAAVAHTVGFFAVVILGRWPEGLFNFLAGVFRTGTRFFAYSYLLTDEYPPFSLD